MAYKSKSYRKFLATGTTAALVASAIAPAASAADHPFTDVNTNYDEAVSYLYSNNITKGYTETTFGTYMSLTRGNAAVIIANALNLDTTSAPDAGFEDVNSRVAGSVNALVEAGIMDGFSDTEFRPDVELSRGAMAKILVNAYGLEDQAMDTPFTDLTSTFGSYIEALYGAGITTGKTETTFGTNQEILRGEFAVLLYKSINFEDVTPEVSSVMSSSSTEFTVNFEEAVEEGVKVEDLNLDVTVVLDNGTEVSPEVTGAKLSADRKSVTVMHENNDLDGLKGSIMVNGVDGAFDYTDAKVASVTSLNATQVEVDFNKAIDASTLFANGKSGAFKTNTVSLSSLDGVSAGALSGELSSDKKTLVITASAPLSKRYDVAVKNLETTDGESVVKYEEMINIAADKTAPSILSSTKLSASTYKVTFSEPLKSLGNVTYKLADGTAASVSTDFVAGAQEVTFTLNGVAANKEVTATIIGAQDQANNLLTPNPSTLSFVKGAADGVAPTVSAISQTGAKKFSVKFSEELISKPVIEINGTVVPVANISKDSADSTNYIVTAPAVLDGATTISVTSFTDLSGENGTAMSKVVTFVKETAAPKVATSTVVVDDTDRKEYLEFTFDKDVELSASSTVDATSGSYVKNYVTTSLANGDIAPASVSYKSASNKKVVRVELDSFLGTKDVKGATYNLNLAFSNVDSVSGVAADTAKTSFTRGEDGTPANTAVVSVASVAPVATDNNEVTVKFDKAVDGASAVNVNNYKIDGAVVESVTLMPVAADGTQVAVLNLKANSNGFTGTRNVTIANVKALGSTKVMNTYNGTVSLTENVAPTVTSAKLLSTNTVELTFSESVEDSTAYDFEVLVGGKSQSPKEELSAAIGSTLTTKKVISINSVDADELSKGLSFKALSTLDIEDANGNKLSVPSNIAISN